MDTLLSTLEWLGVGDRGDDVPLTDYLQNYEWTGFWPETFEELTSFGYLYSRFLFVVPFIVGLWTFISLITMPITLESLSEHLYIIMHYLSAIAKLFRFVVYSRRLKEIFSGLEVLQNRHAGKASSYLLKRAKRGSKFISYYVKRCVIWNTVLMTIAVWSVHMYWQKPVFATLPFCDMTRYPCFVVNLSVNIGAMVFTYISIAICDLCLVDVLAQTLFEYKILNHNLFHIKEHVIKKLYGYNQPVIRRGLALQARRVLPVLGDEVRVEMEVDEGTPGGHRGQCPLSKVNDIRCLGRDDEVVLRMTSRRRTHLTSRTIRKECGLTRRRKEGGRLARRINEEGRRTGRINEEGIIARRRKEEGRPARRINEEGRRAGRIIEERIMARRVTEEGRLARGTKEEGKVTRSLILEQYMEAELETCVKHHQDLIRLTNEIGSFYSIHVFSQVAVNLTTTTMLVFYFSVISSLGLKELSVGITVLLTILQLFMFCWFSNQITQESSNVRDSVYGCDWLETSESFKRSMRVIMSRSNDPVVIYGGGFLPISMETFYAVTKSTYSYYMALRTINENIKNRN